ncbi:hypothetical protein B0H14DRAFT_2876581 [Mycena olivaceomarginata]|nr:hypothetical protein B0H14DRAFT_2876581 [Mycena olivaceomarginata]
MERRLDVNSPDPFAQEVSRYADARDLLDQYETLLQDAGFSFSSEAESDDLMYFLSLTDLKILQDPRRRTWLYSEDDSHTPLINTKDMVHDSKNRKYNGLLDSFSHFVYDKSNGVYVYHHFSYCWLDSEEGGGPFIVYFQSSSNTGDTCHNDGGKLGIRDFLVEHECNEICKPLGLREPKESQRRAPPMSRVL